MKERNRSSVEVVNGIVLHIFKLNGYFIKAADCLTKGSDLTSARCQVLGTGLHEQHTVAAIARNMGLAHQSVQRIADILVIEGLAEFLPNAAHRRAKLLSLRYLVSNADETRLIRKTRSNQAGFIYSRKHIS